MRTEKHFLPRADKSLKTEVDKLLAKRQQLNHLQSVKVVSHKQRTDDDWFLNSIMLDGYDVPFKYRRKQKYRDLKNAYVNVTYYPTIEVVAGMEFETMKVVRIRIT
jgi:hypothetical protein